MGGCEVKELSQAICPVSDKVAAEAVKEIRQETLGALQQFGVLVRVHEFELAKDFLGEIA